MRITEKRSTPEERLEQQKKNDWRIKLDQRRQARRGGVPEETALQEKYNAEK